MKQNQTGIPFIRDLCKGKPEERIVEAEENFLRYLQLVKRICIRLEREEAERRKIDSALRAD